jgi:hypothetical protein
MAIQGAQRSARSISALPPIAGFMPIVPNGMSTENNCLHFKAATIRCPIYDAVRLGFDYIRRHDLATIRRIVLDTDNFPSIVLSGG